LVVLIASTLAQRIGYTEKKELTCKEEKKVNAGELVSLEHTSLEFQWLPEDIP